MANKFIHLHTHSHYSLLEALPKIPDLVNKAKDSGMEALALTDSGNLYGAIEFYKECKSAGIKPILGIDAYVAARGRKDKEGRIDSQRSRLVLLAKDDNGYKNLIKLVTDSFFEGFYFKPRVDKELLEIYKDGLIAIWPAVNNERPEDAVPWYLSNFGKENFYIEITHHPDIPGHEQKIRERLDYAKKNHIHIVAAHDVYYLEPEDKPAQETLISIQGHMADNNSGAFGEEDADFSFIGEDRAEELFRDEPEALKNTLKIAEACNLELELGKWVFPNFEIESGLSPDDELRNRVYEGFKERRVEKSDENIKRVEYELGIIKAKGYSKYFLVVADLMRFSRENGILSNIRGSVSGSMVTYLAGITNIDPLAYEIPFERFLNPDRPSAPDIDMDFADNRRDEVIEYARKKYGADHVAQIGTFGTMMARGAVRDVARAMSYPYELGDRIAKLIPMGMQGFPMTIERAMNENPDFKKLYEEDTDAKAVIDMARKIEGNARHISVHAAGVVISPSALTDYTPLQYDTKGEKKIITQYDMYSIEEAGLLKFDFLGIRNLSIIADTLERIKKIGGKTVELDKIPIDDKKTFAMLARGETEGTFQLNGDAMTKFLMELKPSTIHDINAMVALYRPGPMQFIPLFIERKHNPRKVSYLDPALKPILEKTYGVLVYQDDLLMIAKDIAGYSWGELDKFRKAVGKKIPAEMRAQKDKFIKGTVEHSKWSQKKAEELWTWIEPFAAYGFNKAHSVSYGWIAYITSYLKANFPAIYMSAVLTAESGDVETIGTMVNECKRMGIEVLPPSVNESYSQFTVVVPTSPPTSSPNGRKGGDGGEVDTKYRIRFGLVTIKNFGQGISTSIIEERKQGGKFTSLQDFLDRVKDKNLNKKSLESLIKSGALDELPATDSGEPADRGVLLANLELLLNYHKEHLAKPKHQDSLFGLFTDTATVPILRLLPAERADQREKLIWEKDLLGLYISGHPLDSHKEKLDKRDINIKKLSDYREGTETVIAGLINEIRDVLTKNNERMVFMRIEDMSGEIDVVIFPRVFQEFRQFVSMDNCIAIKGKVSKRNGETSFIAEKIKNL